MFYLFIYLTLWIKNVDSWFRPSKIIPIEPWAPAGMGKGDTCPWKCYKVFFVLQMLSKVSVTKYYALFWENVTAASGGKNPDLHRGSVPPGVAPAGGLPSFRFPHCHPRKILWGPWLSDKVSRCFIINVLGLCHPSMHLLGAFYRELCLGAFGRTL